MTLDHSEMSTSEPLLFAERGLASRVIVACFFESSASATTPFHDPLTIGHFNINEAETGVRYHSTRGVCSSRLCGR